MKVHQFRIPTHIPDLGPVNVHIIDADPLTLVDTGPKIPAAYEALQNALHSLGKRVEDVERVVLTHLHEDHCGLAGRVQRVSGATIFAHPWEGDRLRAFDDYLLYLPLLERAGVPQDVIDDFKRRFEARKEFVEPFDEVEGIEDGDTIDFERGSLQVLHTPGHTPGSCCLFRAADRSLIAADTVLKDITPNPVLCPDPLNPSRRFPSLSEYLVSLARIRSLGPGTVRGGHGGDVTDFEAHFVKSVRMNDDRQRKLVGLLGTEGKTAWEATQLMFPKARGGHSFLALSETLAHLDFAVDEDRASVATDGAVERFTAVRST